jgi:hypothetical protein
MATPPHSKSITLKVDSTGTAKQNPYRVMKNKGKIYEGKWLIVKPNGDTLGLINSLVDCGIILDFFEIKYIVER